LSFLVENSVFVLRWALYIRGYFHNITTNK
jgi:hypothetical protein